MKLLHLKDQTEKHEVKVIDGLTISVQVYDIQKQWSVLQNLVQEIANDDFEGIVVSTKLGSTSDYWGLEFCMRLRLSYSLIGVKAFSTLFVYTESPVEELIKEQTEQKTQPTATLLLTKGSFAFDSFDLFTVISLPPSNYHQLNEGNYETAFLDVIKINKPPEVGHHSLANLLGATRLAEITGNRDVIDTNAAISAKKTDLYFKFKTDFNTNVSSSFSKKTIQADGKHILLIDDKENFGWSDVLRRVFKDALFDFVEAGENFVERAEKKASEKDETTYLPKWDLILLDLRLEEIEDSDELVHKKASEYSGGNLLKKLKETNRGIQIIVFTASNKAWNYRELYDLGADGYFVKEAPELKIEDDVSKKNFESFEKQVDQSFKRQYLKQIYSSTQFIDARLDKENGILCNKNFSREKVNLISAYLKQAYNSLSSYSDTRKEYTLYCFLDYFKIIETIANALVIRKGPGFSIKALSPIEFIKNDTILQSKIEPIKAENGSILSFRVNEYTPDRNEENFYYDPSSSTKFSAIMLLKFRLGEEDVKEFISLNNLRNTIVAHSAKNLHDEINITNVLQLVYILKQTFQKI